MTDLVLVQMLLAGFVLYTCFCRLVFTQVCTSCVLRSAIIFKAAAAALVMGAPVWPLIHPHRATWEPWSTPVWAWIALLTALAFMQWVTSRHWGPGGPAPMKPGAYQGDTL